MDYKRNAFMEADLRCSNTIQNMEKRLRAACHASDANVDNVVKVSIFFSCIINYKLPGHPSFVTWTLLLSVSHYKF
jgi:enamine deaminase RidA (YjgF/YER057c/UK114 family)